MRKKWLRFNEILPYLKLPRCYVNRIIESVFIDKKYVWNGLRCTTMYLAEDLKRVKTLDIYVIMQEKYKERLKLKKLMNL